MKFFRCLEKIILRRPRITRTKITNYKNSPKKKPTKKDTPGKKNRPDLRSAPYALRKHPPLHFSSAPPAVPAAPNQHQRPTPSRRSRPSRFFWFVADMERFFSHGWLVCFGEDWLVFVPFFGCRRRQAFLGGVNPIAGFFRGVCVWAKISGQAPFSAWTRVFAGAIQGF